MKCPECGEGILKDGILNLRAEVKGEFFHVQFPGTECQTCGFQVIDSDRMTAYGLVSADAYRAKHRLLTSAEIKARREELGMSQVEFAKHTKASLPSIKRWELGAIQDEAMDELLRLKTDPNAAQANLEEARRLLRHNKTLDEAMVVTLKRGPQRTKRSALANR